MKLPRYGRQSNAMRHSLFAPSRSFRQHWASGSLALNAAGAVCRRCQDIRTVLSALRGGSGTSNARAIHTPRWRRNVPPSRSRSSLRATAHRSRETANPRRLTVFAKGQRGELRAMIRTVSDPFPGDGGLEPPSPGTRPPVPRAISACLCVAGQNMDQYHHCPCPSP